MIFSAIPRELTPHQKETAYSVPWVVDRSGAPWCRVINSGPDTLRCVSTQVFTDAAMTPATAGVTVRPGDEVRVVVSDSRSRHTARVTVHWRVHAGSEFAWTFVL